MTAAVALVVVGGLSLRTTGDAQPVRVADETSGVEAIVPGPDAAETTGLPVSSTVTSSTTVPPTTVSPTETTMARPAPTLVPALAPAADTDPTPSSPGAGARPTSPPAVTTPPAAPSTSEPSAPASPVSPQTVEIEVSGAGTITLEHTAAAITEVGVTTTGGYAYTIEDRTVHEVKVEFEGGGPQVEVEIHLEDGEITYQIDGDEDGS